MGSPIRIAAVVALLAGVVAIIVLSKGKTTHTVTVLIPEATGLVETQRVSDGANDIGSVADIEAVRGGRAARLKLSISDEDYWPLTENSKLEIRLGGTASYSNRYLYLKPGRGGAVIPEGGSFPEANVKTPFELDDLINHVTPPVRDGIQSTVAGAAGVAADGGSALRSALPRTPALTKSFADFFGDLAADQESLKTLVVSGDNVIDAVHRSDPDIRVLFDGFAQTADAIADEASPLKLGLDRLPAALVQTRETLGRARGTLVRAGELTDALKPGIVQLRQTSAPLVRTLDTLSEITPLALAALSERQQQRLTSGATLLRTLGSVSPRLASLGRQAATQVGCLRPWIPEITAFGAKWGDWMSPVDDRDHLIRAQIQNFLPANSNSTPITPADAARNYPGVTYGFPRPPGTLAGQPWFQPQCGVTQDALDPTKDKEGLSFREDQQAPEAGR